MILITVAFFVVSSAKAQDRDYMTEAEIELVRDSQWIDLRINVLVKMIDRRFSALGIDVSGWKQSEKDSKLWGEMPTGTRSELLWDVRHLLQKAIDDIDDTYAHPEVDKSLEPAKKGDRKFKERFPVAIKELGKAAQRYLPALKTELASAKGEKEFASISASIEFCEQIIEASERPSNFPGIN